MYALSAHGSETDPGLCGVPPFAGGRIQTSSSVQPMVTYQGMGCYFGSKEGPVICVQREEHSW